MTSDVRSLGLVRAWGPLVRRRLGEGSFWIIQFGVLAVSAVHLAIEISGLQGAAELGGLPYAPMVLHLLPVAYAGYVYGYEGSVLTGLWSGLLALPNMLVWHDDGLGWVTDLIFTVFVILLGIVVAVPVERERRQRRRAEQATRDAEAANRRVALLHEVASTLVASASPNPLAAALERLRRGAGWRWAAVAVGAPDGTVEVLGVAGAAAPEVTDAAGDPAAWRRSGWWRDGHVVGAALVLEDDAPALLLADGGEHAAATREETELLLAAAHQFAVALVNARLHAAERERMRTYVQEVTRAQERERARIARDLHDVVAQDLVVLERHIDAAAAAGPLPAADRVPGPHEGECPDPSPDPAARHLRVARGLAASALQVLRRYSRDLRPTILDDLGLVPALHWLVTDADGRDGVAARFRSSGALPRLEEETQLALFRVTQEALRNALRHGGATQVTVTLEAPRDGSVTLTVEDDGTGFEVPEPLEQLTRRGSLGLLGMRERVELVGGRFDIASARGRGTRVTVRLPTPESRTSTG